MLVVNDQGQQALTKRPLRVQNIVGQFEVMFYLVIVECPCTHIFGWI